MSKLTHIDAGKSQAERAIDEIKSIMGQSGGTINQKENVQHLIALESLDGAPLVELNRKYISISQQLMDSPAFGKMISDMPQHQQKFALESAVMTMLASGDTLTWHTSAAEPKRVEGVKMVNPNQGALDYLNSYALEGFEPASLNQFLPQSVFVNAMAAVQGGFEETFYPIQIIPAGTQGVTVSISVPKIYSAGARNQNGTPYDITKTNIIKAIVDGSLLENNSTKIVPVAANDVASPNNKLVLATAVSDETLILNGEAIASRPILFGKEIDLIGISTTTALLNNGVMNETDVLDNVINVGKLYFTATVGTDSVNVAYDVSNQPGSLLQRTVEMTDKGFQTTFTARVVVTADTPIVGGTGTMPDFEAAMGTVTKLVGKVLISATANTEFANMTVVANNAVWEKAFNAEGESVAVPTGSITMLGYRPAARRTNNNIRSRGTIIDSSHLVSYCFPVPLSSPIISQQPVGSDINTSIEGLAHVERIRNSNNAVKSFFSLRDVLAAGSTEMPVGFPTMGAELVLPTYHYTNLALEGVVPRMAGKDSVDDLRGVLTASIMSITNKLLQDSQYLAALEFATGNNEGYEVIIVTDTVIYPWLMESGDSRTLGAQRKFKITQNLNADFKGKIFISFRRATRDGTIHPLDFGTFCYTPALTHQLQVQRSGATINELHTIPRNAYYTTLPILGEIDVSDIMDLFTVEETVV